MTVFGFRLDPKRCGDRRAHPAATTTEGGESNGSKFEDTKTVPWGEKWPTMVRIGISPQQCGEVGGRIFIGFDRNCSGFLECREGSLPQRTNMFRVPLTFSAASGFRSVGSRCELGQPDFL